LYLILFHVSRSYQNGAYSLEVEVFVVVVIGGGVEVKVEADLPLLCL
jgi:hypothetical protein